MIYSLKNVVKFEKSLNFKYTLLLIILLSISIFYETDSNFDQLLGFENEMETNYSLAISTPFVSLAKAIYKKANFRIKYKNILLLTIVIILLKSKVNLERNGKINVVFIKLLVYLIKDFIIMDHP